MTELLRASADLLLGPHCPRCGRRVFPRDLAEHLEHRCSLHGGRT